MMTSRFAQAFTMVFLGALVVEAPGVAIAEESVGSCSGVVGTYITTNVGMIDGQSEVIGRSLISLTSGGLAFLTDSNEAGVSGFPPFTDGRGSWRCERVAEGREHLRAVVLDFTIETRQFKEQQLARLDYDAAYDAKTDSLSAEVKLAFAPFDANPMDKSAFGEPTIYSFVGARVEPDQLH